MSSSRSSDTLATSADGIEGIDPGHSANIHASREYVTTEVARQEDHDDQLLHSRGATLKTSKIDCMEIEMGQQPPREKMIQEAEESEDIENPSSSSKEIFVSSILRRDSNHTESGIVRDDNDDRNISIQSTLSEDEPNDMQSLLGSTNGHTDRREEEGIAGTSISKPLEIAEESIDSHPRRWCLPCVKQPQHDIELHRMGNIKIIFPRLYVSTGGWGVLGPHWFGPPCILLILFGSSYYFIYTCSWSQKRYATAVTCCILAFSTFYFLIQAAYRDPGVIIKGRYVLPDPIPRTYRWCETCQFHQPPRAAHCPDCNVCVAGFDHHCVWMSMCIGKGNFKPFMRFNLSWMVYLLYAIIWVSIVAPILDNN